MQLQRINRAACGGNADPNSRIEPVSRRKVLRASFAAAQDDKVIEREPLTGHWQLRTKT
jgi:hypothetical protein